MGACIEQMFTGVSEVSPSVIEAYFRNIAKSDYFGKYIIKDYSLFTGIYSFDIIPDNEKCFLKDEKGNIFRLLSFIEESKPIWDLELLLEPSDELIKKHGLKDRPKITFIADIDSKKEDSLDIYSFNAFIDFVSGDKGYKSWTDEIVEEIGKVRKSAYEEMKLFSKYLGFGAEKTAHYNNRWGGIGIVSKREPLGLQKS